MQLLCVAAVFASTENSLVTAVQTPLRRAERGKQASLATCMKSLGSVGLCVCVCLDGILDNPGVPSRSLRLAHHTRTEPAVSSSAPLSGSQLQRWLCYVHGVLCTVRLFSAGVDIAALRIGDEVGSLRWTLTKVFEPCVCVLSLIHI